MNTRMIRINADSISPDVIRGIAGTLRQGGVIVYPTDTFYGLGADCFSRAALLRITEIKGRPPTKGFLVLVSDAAMARGLAAEVPAAYERLAEAFWPGPLTMILKAAPRLPDELVGPERTIGVRLPALPWLRELVGTAGFPVVSTSANLSGGLEIDSGEEAARQFAAKVDLVVDGGRTAGGLPSTVVDLTSGKPLLRREGPIPRAALESVIPIF